MILIEFGVTGNPFDPQMISVQLLESSDRLARLILESFIIIITSVACVQVDDTPTTTTTSVSITI